MFSSDPLELTVSHPTRRVAFAPIRGILQLVATGEGVQIGALSLVFADHATVKRLNQTHLGRAYLTDVIAFDLREKPGRGPVDGEIYVDLDTAAERAPEFRARYADEVRRYVVHGFLHLVGYRDDTEAGKEEMTALEDKYLKDFEMQ